MTKETYKAILSFMPKNKNARILDVGCGEGELIDVLLENGFSAIRGCDIKESSSKYIDYGDAINLSYDSSGFDVVILCSVIEHVENPLMALREARRVCRDGGSIILLTPNVCSFWNRIYFLLTKKSIYHRKEEFEIGHINFLPEFMLDDLFYLSGLKAVSRCFVPGRLLNIFPVSQHIVYKLKKKKEI